MKLHIFNPEHDLALAANLSNFTAPHAGRQLHTDLGYIPALWAADDDYVLVDNIEDAQTAFSRLMHRPFTHFVEKHQLAKLTFDAVEPWGWDLALRAFLLRYGVSETVCPTESDIAVIRALSHRKTAIDLLSGLCTGHLESLAPQPDGAFPCLCDTLEGVERLLGRWQQAVLKAPWSSSGRGIRFVSETLDSYQRGWLQNILERQGSIVVEPYYNKVKDFAMEFHSDGQGCVSYRGLSLFHTSNGAYTGNILAPEDTKRELISRYVNLDLLDAVNADICRLLGAEFAGKYQGPFGIDMMIVTGRNKDGSQDQRGFLLHPCVEINLRRTMGHVALSILREGVMQIDYRDNHYKLKIQKQ